LVDSAYLGFFSILLYIILLKCFGAQQLVAIFGSILFILIYFAVLEKLHIDLYININVKTLIHRILYFDVLFFTIALVFIILIPPIDDLFVEWNSIPIFNWFRFFASFIVFGILPGYTIITLCGLSQIDILEKFILSFGLSLFLSPFFILVLFKLITVNFFYLSLVVINAFFILIIWLKHMKRHSESIDFIRIKFTITNDIVLLLGILIFYIVSWLYFDTSNAIFWDVAPVYAGVLSMMKGVYPNTRGYMFLQYIWYQLWLFGITLLSGLPPINVRTLMIIQHLLYPLAYYIVVRTLTDGDSKVSTIATLFFTLFGDLSWTRLIGIKQGSELWLEIVDRIYKLYPVQPLALFTALTAFFIFIYLFVNKKITIKNKIVLIPLLTWAVYLIHIAETFYIIVFLTIFAFMNVSNDNKKYYIIILLVTISILSVPIFDLLFAEPVYVLNSARKISFAAFACSLMGILFLVYIANKVRLAIINILDYKNLMRFLFIIILGIILIGEFIRPSIVGIFAFGAVFRLIMDRKLNSNLYYLPSFMYSILFIASYLIPSITGLYETRRILDVADAWLSILGAFGFVYIIEMMKNAKNFVIYFVLVTFLLGLPSTICVILSADRASPPYGNEFKEEMELLSKIWKHGNLTDGIFALSESSYKLIGYFTGLKYYNQPEWPFEASIFSEPPSCLETLFQFLGGNPKWFYIRQYEVKLLNEKGKKTFLTDFINLLPEFYNSSISTAYYVPRLSPPDYQSKFAILVPPPSKWNLNNYFYPIMIMALANVRYTVIYDIGEFNLSNYSVLLITSDLSSHTQYNIIDWVKKGGTAIILSEKNSILCSNFRLQISSYRVTVDGIAGENYVLRLPCSINFSRIISAFDSETKVVFWYTNNGTPVAPFVLERIIGNGKVIFIDLLTYFDAIKYNKKQFYYLNILEKLLEYGLGIRLEKRSLAEKWFTWPDRFVIKNGIYVEGKVYVNSSQIVIDNPLHLDKLEIMGLVNGKGERLIDEYNSPVITNLEIDGSNIIFDFLTGQVIPYCGAYINISSDNPFNLTLKLTNESKLKIVFKAQNKIFNLTIDEGEVRFVRITKNSAIVLREPSFIVEGKTTFGSVFAYDFLNYGKPFETFGRTKFTIFWSDKGVILAGNFNHDS
jgi:hypothetical protein